MWIANNIGHTQPMTKTLYPSECNDGVEFHDFLFVLFCIHKYMKKELGRHSAIIIIMAIIIIIIEIVLHNPKKKTIKRGKKGRYAHDNKGTNF